MDRRHAATVVLSRASQFLKQPANNGDREEQRSITMDALFRKLPSLGYSDLVTSETAGWKSLGLRLTKTLANRDEFESAPMTDVGVHIVLEEESGREAFLSGRWRKLEAHRGKVATTLPGETWRLRYNNRIEINTNSW